MLNGHGMTIRAAALAGAMALGGCGAEPDVSPPAAVQRPAAAPAQQPAAIAGPARRILAFGDSLFAGYGLEQGESYPDRLEAALRARGIDARVSNAGVSGDTTAAGRQRLAFVLDNAEQAPDFVIVELGGNDLLRGLPPAQTRANLDAILAELDRRGIPAMLFGLRAPPNLGDTYVREFNAIYPDLAEKHDVPLVPFFLEAVATRPDLVQPDRIHPTAAGIEAMVAATADDVEAALPDDD